MVFFKILCFILATAFITNGEGCGDDCLCGISNNIPEYEDYNNGISQDRILGGKNSDPKNWPFLASTECSLGDCTASIIHNQWILSAAHCNPENEMINVTINGENYEAEQFFIHEDYNDTTSYENDIMLIKLKEPLTFTESISSVCLLQNLTANELEVAAAVGFGDRFIRIKTLNDTYLDRDLDLDEFIMVPSGRLRETPVLIREWNYCELSEETNEERICAGGSNRGTTFGDSGGPLLLIRDHRWVQFGVVSVGKFKPIEGDLLAIKDLGIYTRVSSYCQWIEETTSAEVTCQ